MESVNYSSGDEIRVGDSVLLDDGEHPGVVHDLIDTAEQRRNWGVTTSGVMIASPFYGMVFLPSESLAADDEIEFVSRSGD